MRPVEAKEVGCRMMQPGNIPGDSRQGFWGQIWALHRDPPLNTRWVAVLKKFGKYWSNVSINHCYHDWKFSNPTLCLSLGVLNVPVGSLVHFLIRLCVSCSTCSPVAPYQIFLQGLFLASWFSSMRRCLQNSSACLLMHIDVLELWSTQKALNWIPLGMNK